MSWRLLSLALFVLCPMASAQEPRSALFGKLESWFKPKSEQVSHPVIVRVREDAFAARSQERVDLTRPVQRVILGTPVHGTSRTVANLAVAPLPREDRAVINVQFQGRVYINTVGVQEPVRVHSRSFTDFAITRQITFAPESGFKVIDADYRGRTQLVIDDVHSILPGLRGRIARRIGWRRASDSRAAAERIAWQQTRDDVCVGFDCKVADRIAELNEQFNLPAYARDVLGDSKDLDIRSSSSADSIQFALGKRGNEPASIKVFEQPPSTPVEIWVHTSVLGGKLIPPVLEPLFALAAPTNPLGAFPLVQAISSPDPHVNTGAVRMQSDWVVIGMAPDADSGKKPHVVAKPPVSKSGY